jgi:hypothetical protein
MGHGEFDDSNQIMSQQQHAINTTKCLVREMDAFDLLINIGDLAYANGYGFVVNNSRNYKACCRV